MALRGWTQGIYWPAGAGTLAWPAGTIAGDTVLLHVGATTSSNPKRQPRDASSWQSCQRTPSTQTWLKWLTAADIASPLPVLGCVGALEVFPGAWRLGQVTNEPGATMSSASSHLIVYGRGRNANALTPSVGKLGVDFLNASYLNRANAIWSLAATSPGFLKLASGFNGSDADAFELIPPAAPAAPTLTSPSAGAQLDPAIANAVRWSHESLAGREQAGSKVRIRLQGATTWSYLVGGSSTAVETSVTSSAQSAPINANSLTSPNVYEWSVSTTEDGINWSPWADTSTFQVIAAPSVTSVTVSAPAGDVTPSVSYTRTIGSGVQVAYQVVVTPATSTSPEVAPIHNTGVVVGVDNPVEIPDRRQWINSQPLKFWVQVWQTGGMRSAWTPGAGTVTWVPPSAPTSVVAADGRPPRVSVSGLTSGLLWQLQASADGGATWVDQGTRSATAATVAVDQPLTAYGVATIWRARRADATGRWSDWTTSVALASTDRSPYMVADDGTWLRVRYTKEGPTQISQTVTVHQMLAGGPPRVDYSPPRGMAGDLRIWLPTAADVADMERFLQDHTVWTMRWAPERNDRSRTVEARPVTRMARAERISRDRLQAAVQHRFLPLSWVEQL